VGLDSSIGDHLVPFQRRLQGADGQIGSTSAISTRARGYPAGTWWLHRFAGVKCAELGATAPPS
jgi:hypothetical protein